MTFNISCQPLVNHKKPAWWSWFWIFTLFTVVMEAGRFILMTGWPSFPSKVTSCGNFFTDGAGNKGMEVWGAAAACESRNLYTVEELHNTIEH